MAYQWHEDSSQENGHIDQLILMPGRTLLKPKQCSHLLIINFFSESLKKQFSGQIHLKAGSGPHEE